MSFKIENRLAIIEKEIGNNLSKNRVNKYLDECFSLMKIHPNNQKVLLIIGNILWANLELEKAIYYYKKCLKLNPSFSQCRTKLQLAKKEKYELVTYLTYYNPTTISNNSIVRAHQSLQKINNEINLNEKITNHFVLKLLEKMDDVLLKEKIDTDLEITQIHRESKGTEFKFYNCNRHFEVFNTFNVIPENCFSCFKILIQPRNILEMLKLYLVFDKLKNKINLTRKCMIELRNNVKGAYKGYVYCVGLEQAKQTLDLLNPILDKTISKNIPRTIRRGCSEFSITYPEFKEVDPNNHNFMKYDHNWKYKEQIIDNKLSLLKKENIFQGETLSGISLKDLLVIRNWLSYAKKIGDKTHTNFLNPQPTPQFLENKINNKFIENLNFQN